MLFMIKVRHVDHFPYVLQQISHQYSIDIGPARQRLELLQLNLQKDQYSNSLSLPVCDHNTTPETLKFSTF